MVRKVEFCVNNLQLGTQRVMDEISLKYPKIKVRSWGCLGYCQECIKAPFALMDDTMYLQADTADLLLAKVERYIERRSAGQA